MYRILHNGAITNDGGGLADYIDCTINRSYNLLIPIPDSVDNQITVHARLS